MQKLFKERQDLVPVLSSLRDSKKIIAYTSGVFDLLHPGHVQYLKDAKALAGILVVGVNSDNSVTKLKGPLRPIVPAEARMQVVAGLESVDFVFGFDEPNNNKNIEILRPDIYVKAGDYSVDKLSSKAVIESYGGRVELVKMISGYSSTAIVNKIIQLSGAGHAEPETLTYAERPAIFVDRDGTLIELIEYLHEPSKVKVIPGALEALKVAQDKGYRIIITTNQPGIGLGYFTKEDLFATNRELMIQASKVGVSFDKIYYSPFSKADNTACRKPGTGMIDRAKKELNIVIEKSFCVGDMTSDLKLAENVGCAGVLVRTGRGGDDRMYEVSPKYTIDSLADLPLVLP